MTLRQEVTRLVQEMNRDVDAVIVEGKHDRNAIRKAGFDQVIMTCSESRGLVAFAQAAQEHDRIAILTDYDREGRKLNGELRDHIPGHKVQPIWRRKLGKLLTRNGRRDIESINNILQHI